MLSRNIFYSLCLMWWLSWCSESEISLEIVSYRTEVARVVTDLIPQTRKFLTDSEPQGWDSCKREIINVTVDNFGLTNPVPQYTCTRNTLGRSRDIYGDDRSVCPPEDIVWEAQYDLWCESRYIVWGVDDDGNTYDVPTSQEEYDIIVDSFWLKFSTFCTFLIMRKQITQLIECE